MPKMRLPWLKIKNDTQKREKLRLGKILTANSIFYAFHSSLLFCSFALTGKNKNSIKAAVVDSFQIIKQSHDLLCIVKMRKNGNFFRCSFSSFAYCLAMKWFQINKFNGRRKFAQFSFHLILFSCPENGFYDDHEIFI